MANFNFQTIQTPTQNKFKNTQQSPEKKQVKSPGAPLVLNIQNSNDSEIKSGGPKQEH